MKTTELHGKLFPAVPVPFLSDGAIAEEGQEAYARWMAAQPIGGVAVWVHTGRGLFLTAEQREYVFRKWREALPEEKRIIAGAGAIASDGMDEADFLSRSEQMARDAARLGADALLCFPPVFYRGKQNAEQGIVRYHQTLAEAGVPLILFYLYEAAGGVTYSPQTLRRLLSLDQVIGIKMATLDSVMTYQDVSRSIAAEFPEKTLVTGEDRFMGYSLLRGARAALVGMGSACVTVQAELIDAALDWKSRPQRFLELCLQVDALAERTFVDPMEGYIQRMMWCLAHHGILDRSQTHDPWGPKLPDAEFETLGDFLSKYEQW